MTSEQYTRYDGSSDNNQQHQGYDTHSTILLNITSAHALNRGMSYQPSLYRANLLS